MLPAGPRSTFSLPPTPRMGARGGAQQVLASIANRIAASQEVKVGTASIGCDGMPNINPLNGTTCQGTVPSSACTLVLYNPQTRAVLWNNVGRALSSSPSSCDPGTTPPPAITSLVSQQAACDVVAARLKAKRRFVDNLGNVYGPTGAWLSGGGSPATLESDYVHRLEIGNRNFKNCGR